MQGLPVEDLGGLTLDERERIGRLICGALHGADPDSIVTRPPLPEVCASPGDDRIRLWEIYAPAADMVIADIERQQEAARERWAAHAPEMD